MKKSLIFKILYLFLVLIVVAGASVFATNTYLASQVSYGNTNVENALNDLYTLKGNDENYSTDEKVVGKWIDGKPLYRKILKYTRNNINPTIEYNHNINNIEHIHLGNGSGIKRSANETNNYYANYYYTPNDFCLMLASDINIWFDVGANFRNTWSEVIFILEYTKTTDNASNN